MRNTARRDVARRLRRVAALAAAVACLTTGTARLAAVAAPTSGLAGSRAGAPHGQSAPVARPPAPVVAVEAFTNISLNPADAWLGTGIAETVAADLDALGLMGAAGRPAAGAGGARWVVTGGYQRLGERLRITARLVEVSTGEVVRSVRLDGALHEAFDLQDRIAGALTADVDLGAASPAGASSAAAPPAGSAAPAGDGPAGRPGTPAPAGLIEGIILPRPTVDDRGERAVDAGEVAARVQAARADGSAPAGAGGEAAAGAAGPLAAGLAPAAGILTGRPSVEPVRVTDPPRIDGRLDDAVWGRAVRITEFVQQQPLDGAPATEQTELYLAYDTQNLYFGMHVHYSDPVLIRANRSDRDQTFSDDTITLYFDPFLDQQRAYVFSVNGYGVQSDAILDSSAQAGGM
ncbi:MAG: hypothetical protein F4018_19285, partial [Acidobacteria bacterium]|nr:hypothetical protein [Acidobacteriota bacterium]